MQAKLLDVIENGTFTRVGDTCITSVDVRIIAATNRSLKDMMRKGLFREDLYYRLNVIPIYIPPLRQRQEDIPALALNIIEKLNRTRGLNKRIDPEVVDRLKRYNFPGNVREVINIMERMIIMSEDDHITLADMPSELKEPSILLNELAKKGMSLKEGVKILEVQMIKEVLRHHESMALAAQALSVHPTTLWRKMGKYGI